MSHKIPREYENPIDNFLYDTSNIINPYLNKINITPNIITTFSLLFTLMSVNYLYNSEKYLAAFFWFLGYYFDCLDGGMARMYNMETKFGDWYDHITDWIGGILLLCVLYLKQEYLQLFIVIVSIILLGVTITNQEKYNKNKSDSLSPLRKILPDMNIEYLRYFGGGTVALVIILTMIL